jgi:predicted nucleotide-binding protein
MMSVERTKLFKKPTGKQESRPDTGPEPVKQSTRSIPGRIPFPRNSLKDALRIATAIWKENGGGPFDPILLAKCLDTTIRSSVFMTLLTASERYGLTEGGVFAKKISMTDLAGSIVSPTDETVKSSLRKALLTPKVFEQFYLRYDRKNLPREEVAKAVLEKEIGLPRVDVDACYDVLMQNIANHNLSMTSGDSTLLYLDNLGKEALPATQPTVPSLLPEKHELDTTDEISTVPSSAEKVVQKHIFVAHGKNKKPADQAVKILEEYGIPHIVATEEPNRGRPIGEKVAEEMKKCTAGIFIFTADEKIVDADGHEAWAPSDNVVYELGAGSVLYGKKIVVFREEGVDFASDFKELGYVTFEKNRLDAKGLALMKELAGLGIVKFTVA